MGRAVGCRQRTLAPWLVGTGFMLLALVPAAVAQDKDAKPLAPGVDYWQPDWMVRELWGPGRMPRGMMVRLLRHTTFMQYGVPKAYDGAKSTVTAGPETIAAGHKIFAERCASCHGPDGLGDGEAAKALSPSPALLAYMIRRPIAVDEYLLWTISDGGKQFGSEMPAFKGTLTEDDIWRVVAYMRAGFPAAGGGAGAPAPKP
jgi:mono/diheme cytochrome c family protein